MHVKSFRDLEVYKLCRKLSKETFEITRSFAKEETYSLTDQTRRSSRSIGAQIAESWARKKYEKHFISKLTDADGEQLETRHWIETCLDCACFTKEQTEYFLNEYSKIGKIISTMISKSDTFCNKVN